MPKIKKKPFVLRGDMATGKWYLGEKCIRRNGVDEMSGKIYDVSESIAPVIRGNLEYVKRLENALIETVRDLYKERGLTCSDRDIEPYFKKLKERVK